MWVRLPLRARCTALCDKVCQGIATGQWFSPGPPVSSTNKTDRHDIAEILLKVALNTINLKPNQTCNILVVLTGAWWSMCVSVGFQSVAFFIRIVMCNWEVESEKVSITIPQPPSVFH